MNNKKQLIFFFVCLSFFLNIPAYCLTVQTNVTGVIPELPLQLNWLDSETEGLAIGRKENKYVMIDFYADWCSPCKELEKDTYKDEQVIMELNDFIKIKVDATKITPKINKLFQKYQVEELPVILFLDKNGKILSDYIITGFKNPKDFIEVLHRVKTINQ